MYVCVLIYMKISRNERKWTPRRLCPDTNMPRWPPSRLRRVMKRSPSEGHAGWQLSYTVIPDTTAANLFSVTFVPYSIEQALHFDNLHGCERETISNQSFNPYRSFSILGPPPPSPCPSLPIVRTRTAIIHPFFFPSPSPLHPRSWVMFPTLRRGPWGCNFPRLISSFL